MPVPQASLDTIDVSSTMHAGDLLLAEFIHRSANDFAVACAELQVAANLPSLAAVRDRLAVTAARMHALASIQRILQPCRGDIVDIGDALCDLCQYHAEARFADQGAFVQLRTCAIRMDAARGLALLMIVSELLTNTARHAFDRPGGRVEVEARTAGETILCSISDNGIGFEAGARKAGAGTALVAELARRADIGLTMPACAAGARFELSVPGIF